MALGWAAYKYLMPSGRLGLIVQAYFQQTDLLEISTSLLDDLRGVICMSLCRDCQK